MVEYLEKRHVPELEAILLELDNSDSTHYALSIDVLELLDANLLLGTMVLHQPRELLPFFDAAIVALQRTLLEAHAERNMMTLKPSCHARLHRMPRSSELRKHTISSIRAADINKLIEVPGTVIRTGTVKMLQTERSYECTQCRHRFSHIYMYMYIYICIHIYIHIYMYIYIHTRSFLIRRALCLSPTPHFSRTARPPSSPCLAI